MLTYFPPNTQPDEQALENGTWHNRDGHGYAIVVPGKKPKLIVRHSLKSDLIDRFMDDRAKYPHGPALFHSRFGTSGSADKFNCHPFYMGGDKRTVVAHNGVLPQYMQPDKKDRRCDTRKAAEIRFATAYGHLSSLAARDRLGEAIGKHNKLVILTTNPDYKADAFIINESSGVWEQGIWYSNYDYVGYVPVKPGAYKWDDDDDDWAISASLVPDDCQLCDSKASIDDESQVCTMCGTCMDCYQDAKDCICYLPVHRFFSEAS